VARLFDGDDLSSRWTEWLAAFITRTHSI